MNGEAEVESVTNGGGPSETDGGPNETGGASNDVLPLRRTSKLTAKALEHYEDKKKNLELKLETLWANAKQELDRLYECPNELDSIQHCVKLARASFNKYRGVEEELITFLTRTNSPDSLAARAIVRDVSESRQALLDKAIHESRSRCQEVIETTTISSRRSSRSSRSRSSRNSSRQPVAINTANTVSNVCAQLEESHINPSTLPSRDNIKAVQEFVQRSASELQINTNQNESNDAAVQGWLEHFARRDLISGSLVKFDDIPENFRPWRTSFQNITGRVRLSANEELDLLVRWCGGESSAIVKQIRAVHINNPTLGLQTAWKRLEETYGRPELVALSLINRVRQFRRIGRADNKSLRDFGDALTTLEYARNDGSLPGLEYLDTFLGINPLAAKLPDDVQEKWRSRAYKFKQTSGGQFPPFTFFAQFVRELAAERCDPTFALFADTTGPSYSPQNPGLRAPYRSVVVNRTKIDGLDGYLDPTVKCPLHRQGSHPVHKCRAMCRKELAERRELIKHWGLCLRCVASVSHRARECAQEVRCAECDSDNHPTVLHPTVASATPISPERPATPHDGELTRGEHLTGTPYGGESIRTSCTEICGPRMGGKSCAKICLVRVYPKNDPQKAANCYVIMDDQSNRSLAKSDLLDMMGVGGARIPYTMNTCSGQKGMMGRRARHLIIESLDGRMKVELPSLLECDNIPDDRGEIPTPDIARHFPHLQGIADNIPQTDPTADILLLLGRDVPQVHKIRESRNGPNNAPWAQRLDFGWVIVGETCLGNSHRTTAAVSTFRTHILDNGRPSGLPPCTSRLHIKEQLPISGSGAPSHSGKFINGNFNDGIGHGIFVQTKDDNKTGESVEDREFKIIMEKQMVRDPCGNLIAPLPFRPGRHALPNNFGRAKCRLAALRKSFSKKPQMQAHYVAFMGGIIERGHAEIAPPLEQGAEGWYLPHFGVYHPKKPDKIRVVFDSSDECNGTSLNKVLLTGPDMLNSLLGILIRFRVDLVAYIADIEQMFHSFLVSKEHRKYLRFLWYKDNDPNNEIIEYQMNVHTFGNSPSPAVATFGLRKTAQMGEMAFGGDSREFVERDFYCDDGLKSLSTPSEAIDLLKRTRGMLAQNNLRLHKIASNSKEVMDAFPSSERAKGLCDLDFDQDVMPLQRSLGIHWDLQDDCFTFQIMTDPKPYTKRGVLSVVNSLYDPLGFVQPVIITGKVLLREMTCPPKNLDWDDPLPTEFASRWNAWRGSLSALEHLRIKRCYTPVSAASVTRRELHVYVDASQIAVAAVAYLRSFCPDSKVHVGFVIGKAKLAPRHATTIPRLELNAAVLGVELAETATGELKLDIDAVWFHSDSRVVLGYIKNRTKRFYVYVANRVQRILQFGSPDRWLYVQTDLNPADHATRVTATHELQNTAWLEGPDALYSEKLFELEEGPISGIHCEISEGDPEIRPQINVYATSFPFPSSLGTSRFLRFSMWSSLRRAICNLIHIAKSYNKTKHCQGNGWHLCTHHPDEMKNAELVILRSAQDEVFRAELVALRNGRSLPDNSRLSQLDPFIDNDGLLRVGGRLALADIDIRERHPIILEGAHHVSTLLAQYFHNEVQHQGRHLTLGAIRSNGYWILGSRRLVGGLIEKCVLCRKQRGQLSQQKMADLPIERITPGPPFTNVGVDVFGHWSVTYRRTRGGSADSKRWAVLFTCFSTRAIHIELIESMDTSAFVNAVRRFIAIRGPAKKFYSDCGSNMVAGSKALDMKQVTQHLLAAQCEWSFNPPHASHMGGVWERMIGLVRRILDVMFAKLGPAQITHDVLHTFLQEVVAIVNSRPLLPVSNDPQNPEILTPATLLTQKTDIISAPPGSFGRGDLFSRQWRRVQYLADIFWTHWRREYLPSLQGRRKWKKRETAIGVGDIVLLKDEASHRNDWPLGRVTAATPSHDGEIRRLEVRTCVKGTNRTYIRPATQLVIILRNMLE